MRKFSLTFVFLIYSLPGILFAQEVKIGVKAGPTYSHFTGTFDPLALSYEKQGQGGFAIGAYSIVPLSEKFAFQPELVYTKIGEKFEGEFDSNTSENTFIESYTFTLAFAQLPLLFKYYPAGGFNILLVCMGMYYLLRMIT
jgi:hypothetical protein